MWLQTVAKIPTDIIEITVEYKYANYVTFEIMSSFMESHNFLMWLFILVWYGFFIMS